MQYSIKYPVLGPNCLQLTPTKALQLALLLQPCLKTKEVHCLFETMLITKLRYTTQLDIKRINDNSFQNEACPSSDAGSKSLTCTPKSSPAYNRRQRFRSNPSGKQKHKT